MTTQLTPNFTLEELTATQQRGLDNTPSDDICHKLMDLAHLLEEVRASIGPMHVNSGYRSVEVNAAVGGASSSQHCKGEACDFTPLKMSKKDAYNAILTNGISFDQLIYEYIEPGSTTGGWIHISMHGTNKPPRGQILMVGKFTGGKYLPYDESKI